MIELVADQPNTAVVLTWVNGQLDPNLIGVLTPNDVYRIGVSAGTHWGPYFPELYRGPFVMDVKGLKLFQVTAPVVKASNYLR